MKNRTLTVLARVGATWICAALVMSCGGGGGGDGAIAPPPAAATLSVYAGSLRSAGSHDGVGIAAQFAQFSGPVDVAQDAAGNVYVADSGNNTIRRIALDGTVTTIAGAAGQTGSADGTGAAARFSGPRGVAVDAAGNVYVSDSGNGTLRKISVQGVVTTIAGVAGQSASIDGDAASARLNKPGSLAIDGAGTIYVVGDNALRKRAPDGSMTTFAGQAGSAAGNPVVSSAAESRFSELVSVAVDGAGNVYVADYLFQGPPGGAIRKFDSQGHTLPFGPSADGVLRIPYPTDISLDASGNLYVASDGQIISSTAGTSYRFISRITPDGMSSTIVAGVNDDYRTVDGPLARARFADPFSIAAGPNGRVVVGELATDIVRLIDTQQGVVSTLAGGLGDGEMDGVAAVSRFNQPGGLATGPDGTLYVADRGNSSVRQISATGVVSTLRHDSHRPFALAIGPNGGTMYAMATVFARIYFPPFVYAVTQDGPAWLSGVTSTASIAVDAAGNLYASTEDSVLPVIGGGVVAYGPDGTKRVLATDTKARALAVDGAGNVYFTSARATLGVISPIFGVTILAGRPDDPGDEDGVGQAARFRSPGALALDPAGNVYVADGTKIRKITPQGTVTTIADISNVQGAQPGFAVSPFTSARGLAWRDGSLYATVLNAVVKITF